MMLLPRSKSCASENFSTRQRQLQDRTGGGVIGEDEGRRGARAGAERNWVCDTPGDLREGQLFVDVRLEKILHHRGAAEVLRFGVLDIVDDGLARCARSAAPGASAISSGDRPV